MAMVMVINKIMKILMVNVIITLLLWWGHQIYNKILQEITQVKVKIEIIKELLKYIKMFL